jgi:2,5-furandicarboxylate decarboxylase 1
MAEDLRTFISRLQAAGLLITLSRPVDTASQAPALMRELERRGKAGLFRQMDNTGFAMAANVLGTREMVALALGVDTLKVNFASMERMRQRVAPELVESGPAQEVVLSGAEADLTRLPLLTHATKDAGPYITAGLVFVRDPDTGKRNVSFNRMQLKGPRKSGIRSMPPQQLGVIQAKQEARGRNLEVAVAIGNHPCDMIAAATTLPLGDDEMALAGALRGEPVPLIRCLTVDLEVPANAEVVLEGEILANTREQEGPFGDFLQFYVPQMENHVFQLKTITHRQNPIWQSIQASSSEDVNLLGISREAQILEAVLHNGAKVVDVRLHPTILGAVIVIEKQFEGEPMNVMMAAFGAYRWLKYCVVVDHDVDPGDEKDVLWTIATRARLADGAKVLDNAAGFSRDPHGIHCSKLAIDATIPLGQWEEFERKRVVNDGQLNLEDYR